MHISSVFDGGNIKCLSSSRADDIQLEIRKDRNSDFFQWFYFRLSGAFGKACLLKIMNAGECAYQDGYVDYQAVASYDRETWFRVPTEFDGQVLTISHTPEMESIYFAYFAPYSMERHADFVSNLLMSPRVHYENLGLTLDGRDMDFFTIGEPSEGKKHCWFMARQHPGETMAEWWMEGFFARLLDEDDPVSRVLLEKCVFYVVPNMNPDGSKRGHLRTNASGANLNREWADPSMDRSPEVFLVREKMLKTGVDFCFDVHGDEALPYNFISGSYGVPSWTPGQEKTLDTFLSALVQASPDFQTKHGYGRDEPGKANLSIAKNYVAETFKCLSMTLEMPFKDTADSPNLTEGWSPERCRHLGSAVLTALYAIL